MTVSNEGHAFISYVREDASRVDRLQAILEAAGVRVWRDTADLWPGEDWRSRIRQAITRNALAFIICFSKNSEARAVSGQNEELILAVDQLRLRRPDQPWLIPVRFDDVEIPSVDLGGGRTLNSIQRADLIGDAWDHGAARLVASVVRALDKPVEGSTLPPPTATLEAQLKGALRDPAGDIALNDILLSIANDAHRGLSDERTFPSSSPALSGSPNDAAVYITDLVDRYMEILNQALDALMISAQWVRDDQAQTLTRFVERLTPNAPGGSGMVVLTSLRWFPLLPVLYTGALASLHHGNYVGLRAIAINATVRDIQHARIPLIGRGHPWRPFSQFELVPQLLAIRASGEELTRELVDDLASRRRGKRYTPVSDYLHDVLRPKFASEVPDEWDYSELFDRAEIFLGLLAIDLRTQRQSSRIYLDGPQFGRFTWRDRGAHEEETVEARMLQELSSQQENWPPLGAGLFGGSVDRATAAFKAFIEGAIGARNQRW